MLLLAADLPVPVAGSAGRWLSRPLWIVLLALISAALVSLFRGAEGIRRAAVTGGGATGRAALGAAAACVGVLGTAMTGLDGLLAGRSITMVVLPMTAVGGLALVGAGWALAQQHRPAPLAVRSRRTRPRA